MFNIAQNNLNMYKRLLECSNKSDYDKKKFIIYECCLLGKYIYFLNFHFPYGYEEWIFN